MSSTVLAAPRRGRQPGVPLRYTKLTPETCDRVGAECLYRVRRYLVDHHYEIFGGWPEPGDAAAYKLIGGLFKQFTITQ